MSPKTKVVAGLLASVSCATYCLLQILGRSPVQRMANQPGQIVEGKVIASRQITEAPADEPEQEVRECEQTYEAAVLAGDVALFEQLLAPDFVHTSHNGKQLNRAEWLANHKPRETPYTALNTDQLKVRVTGPTAIVTGKISPTGRSSSGAAIEGEYRFIRVWTRNGDKWQIMAFQSTRIVQN